MALGASSSLSLSLEESESDPEEALSASDSDPEAEDEEPDPDSLSDSDSLSEAEETTVFLAGSALLFFDRGATTGFCSFIAAFLATGALSSDSEDEDADEEDADEADASDSLADDEADSLADEESCSSSELSLSTTGFFLLFLSLLVVRTLRASFFMDASFWSSTADFAGVDGLDDDFWTCSGFVI